MQSDDPTVVEVLVVHAEDVVTALEANVRRDAGAVVRATPPFAPRMRARLHLVGRESTDGDIQPLHVAPETLVPEAPAFPDPDDTEDRLRGDPDAEYSPERHREAHADAVAGWRETVRDRIAATVRVETPSGPHEIEVSTLG